MKRFIRVSRRKEGPTQGEFDQLLLDRHKMSYPYVDAILHDKLLEARGVRWLAVANTISYFDRKDAQAAKARKTALDVSRHERADEMKLRAMVGAKLHRISRYDEGGGCSEPIPVSRDVASSFIDETSKHDIDGGSRKSGKRKGKKPIITSTWLDRAMREA